jgi:3-oxoacyl-(acyl-carrier-protein) synthase
MVQFNRKDGLLVGQGGSLVVREDDEMARKLAMLIEGECEGLGPIRAAEKYGYSKQRYFQIRHIFLNDGTAALASQRRGPKSNYRRTSDIVRQIIRYRFLDPQVSSDVIGQKLRQLGVAISTRSVERVIADYGLQKKTPQTSARKRRSKR